MAKVLLLGAGFSRNWGGPLAAEMFDWLLQKPEIESDQRLRQLLWDNKGGGGFENALSQVQADYLQSSIPDNKARLERFQAAVNAVFADMDQGFASLPTWEFQNDSGRQLVSAFVKFDAIFTLNQDLLFERFYINENVSLVSRQQWNGCVMPGMRALAGAAIPYDVGQTIWTPDAAQFSVPAHCQPYFKLHGSYRWEDGTGNRLMVMGGSKAVMIRQHAVLAWYFSEFQRYLGMGGTKLMVMGYGFGDHHVNETIMAAQERDLKMFIVDPLGVDVANPDRGLPLQRENPFKHVIVGASKRGLRETFGNDVIEHGRLMQFLA
ncbi:MAG TPA: SIR2 family protein [Patescibacteria group bacterium]|nr:SIR2 family protein [Patescibacteria group bacterium]